MEKRSLTLPLFTAALPASAPRGHLPEAAFCLRACGSRFSARRLSLFPATSEFQGTVFFVLFFYMGAVLCNDVTVK